HHRFVSTVTPRCAVTPDPVLLAQTNGARSPGPRSGSSRAAAGSADLADAVADERYHLQAVGPQQLAHGLGVVLDERLLDQDVLREPGLQLALQNLLLDGGRLARVLRVGRHLG